MGRGDRARILGAAASRLRGVIAVDSGRRRDFQPGRDRRIQRTGVIGVSGVHGHQGRLDGQGDTP